MAKQVKVLRVVAKREGFRRAGMEFGSVPKNLPLDDLPHDAHQAIKSDPNLVTFETVMHLHENGSLVDVPHAGVGDLDKRAAELNDLKAELQRVASELDESGKALRLRQVELDERQRELDQREADLVAREKALAKAGSATKKSGS
ncbi:hypothetical protein [Ralstonia sp. ASV6]|uniref:hypothetical protein n=1 Tax=Ralstonia sp. ASV6 TaxID=2795124 RepID=UPI0018EC7D97|nr:hypothetical protein [Ralstonia sp. ASV6]